MTSQQIHIDYTTSSYWLHNEFTLTIDILFIINSKLLVAIRILNEQPCDYHNDFTSISLWYHIEITTTLYWWVVIIQSFSWWCTMTLFLMVHHNFYFSTPSDRCNTTTGVQIAKSLHTRFAWAPTIVAVTCASLFDWFCACASIFRRDFGTASRSSWHGSASSMRYRCWCIHAALFTLFRLSSGLLQITTWRSVLVLCRFWHRTLWKRRQMVLWATYSFYTSPILTFGPSLIKTVLFRAK